MSQTFYKKGFLALAVATALGVSAFAQADIKIGVAGPMTGANAAFGEQYMKGAQAAAKNVLAIIAKFSSARGLTSILNCFLYASVGRSVSLKSIELIRIILPN